ncbi:hypothetical protein HII31_12102 [Pseudocercospora fuligena]|uniref:Ig-like domain-containing protein n=1 Tax=Pseudocercospora fuligena TaxID=685502 RepID=A0A8H6R8V8_9PEZI|nr:hypothetical protein HII31_12102 [Pseudocercospora fuligena]
MKVLQLPPSLLLAIFTYSASIEATPAPPPQSAKFPNKTRALPSTGSGSSYASACQDAITSYFAGSSAWVSSVQTVSNTTQLEGGTSISTYTLYENATTLCDMHPRVTYSPAISIGMATSTYPGPITGTTTIANTYWFGDYPSPSPTCSISPKDCDPLWADYSKSLLAASTMTAPPALVTPPCANQSAAAEYSSATEKIYGCGECTIYGDGVELVYFPTSAERDMCATTPTASLTSYGSGAVITAYAGKSYQGPDAVNGSKTVVVDGHTFTSGTAYISISKVYAVDRCSNTHGTPVTDAILAMPSESVLSLRYSQNHFQRLMETDKITGYPVSYADFNTPIPWSAWNGQNLCEGSYDTWYCGVIYENNFRPQLAIPPEITQLSPEFKGCQLWYNGLWDPPLRLTEVDSAAKPTLPTYHTNQPAETSKPAAPSSAAAAPTSTPTAIPNELPGSSNAGSKPSQPAYGPTVPNAVPTHTGNVPSSAAETNLPSENTCVPSKEPWEKGFTVGGHTLQAHGRGRKAVVGSVTCVSGGPAQTITDGIVATYGDQGLIFETKATASFDDQPQATPSQGQSTIFVQHTTAPGIVAGPETVTVTIAGQVETVVQSSYGGPIKVGPMTTLTPGGPASTLSNGQVMSAASDGLILQPAMTTGSGESGDADTITLTIGGQVETAVQSQDGGPIVVDGSITLTPGGPTTTLNGEMISAATNGIVYGGSTTLGVDAQATTGSGSSESASSRVPSSTAGDDSSATSTTSTDEGVASATGAAMQAFEGANVAAVVAIFVAVIAV